MKIGKVPENILKRSVLKQIKTKKKEVICGAGIGEDCAIFSFADGARIVTCMQESEIILSGSSCFGAPFLSMSELIQKCANNLAAAGARIATLMLTMILPEETEEAQIRVLMAEAEAKCSEISVAIAGGQTRISKAVSEPMAIVTGYGIPFPEWNGQASFNNKAVPGQDVVISKWVGLQGTAILAKRNKESLLSRYPAYLVNEAAGFDRYLNMIPEAATAVKSGVCAMHDASEGGIFGALWELAEKAGVGLTIEMKKIPLRQETVEVCEFCNVNPYELLSGGCMVMTAWDGQGLVMALQAEGIPAVIVGKITDSNDRLILNEDEVRYMDRPKGDEIYKHII